LTVPHSAGVVAPVFWAGKHERCGRLVVAAFGVNFSAAQLDAIERSLTEEQADG
jgi:hypothetical protein